MMQNELICDTSGEQSLLLTILFDLPLSKLKLLWSRRYFFSVFFFLFLDYSVLLTSYIMCTGTELNRD